MQRGKYNTIVRIVRGSQWDNLDRIRPLHLFIGKTSSKAAMEEDDRSDTDKVKVFGAPRSISDFQSGMFAKLLKG